MANLSLSQGFPNFEDYKLDISCITGIISLIVTLKFLTMESNPDKSYLFRGEPSPYLTRNPLKIV